MGIATGLNPLAFIVTTDRERAKLFYGETLGLTKLREDPFALVYDMAGISLNISTVEAHTPAAHTVLGWQTLDINAAARALRDKGVTCSIYPGFGQDELGVWSVPDGGAKGVWFNDPDGNVLSLTEF